MTILKVETDIITSIAVRPMLIYVQPFTTDLIVLTVLTS